MYIRWLSIKRWNNFPRIEDINPLDNTWFVIHIALFLSHLEEKKWRKPDKFYIIKKLIFDLFKVLILYDINSWTRDYINKIDSSFMSDLEKEVLDYIYSLNWWDFLKEDMKNLYALNMPLEDEIILASKKFAGYNECIINSRVFLYTYDVALEEINSFFNNTKLLSIKELLKNDSYKIYLWHIRRLSHCKRWAWKNRNYEISVMWHLVLVTFISYIVWNIENINNNKNYDIFNLILSSLYNDISESITWYINITNKKNTKKFEEILPKLELKMMNDYFFSYIWEDYKKSIMKYMLNPISSPDRELTKMADLISSMYESKIEFESWNLSFSQIYIDLKRKVNDFDMFSSNMFLKEINLSFEETNIDSINI